MDKKKLAEAYVSFLSEEGYRPSLDKDQDVTFKKEGWVFLILIDPDDPVYLRVVCPNFWNVSSDEERSRVLAACSTANQRTKAVKFYLISDSLWAATEMFFADQNGYKPVFERILNTMVTGVSSLVSDLTPSPAETGSASPPASAPVETARSAP